MAERGGPHAGVCVPVLAAGEVRGAIEFLSAQTGAPDDATQELLGTIAEQLDGLVSLLDQRAELVAEPLR